MKTLGLFAATVLFSFTLNAQDAATKATDAKPGEVHKLSTAHKDHKCTAACKEAGACVMAHGEKGHKCSSTCGAETTSVATPPVDATPAPSPALKAHVSTAKCKDAGKCVSACGEKGHTCSAACAS